jgi:hypothetical protein
LADCFKVSLHGWLSPLHLGRGKVDHTGRAWRSKVAYLTAARKHGARVTESPKDMPPYTYFF